MVLWESDGKYSRFDEIWQTRHFWEQTGSTKEKDRQIITICRTHQLHLIPGTVALADITEQTRIYHYTNSDWLFFLKIRGIAIMNDLIFWIPILCFGNPLSVSFKECENLLDWTKNNFSLLNYHIKKFSHSQNENGFPKLWLGINIESIG